jgi:hypothetical protein
MRHVLSFSFLLLGSTTLAGCHTFQPTSYDRIAPGQEVRARLSGVWADSLDSVLQKDSRTVEGTVVGKADGDLLLEVAVQNELRGMRFETLSQRVRVPRDGFLNLELKELDRGRTVGAAALVAAAVGALIVKQLTSETGGSGSPGTPGPTEARIFRSLLRIPLPWTP